MSKLIAIVIGVVLLVSLVLFSMTYTVNYHEIAIKTRFGKTGTESVIDKPGLKLRLPLNIDTVTKIDKRLQLRESPLETIQTSDGQQVVVRAFMMWKVRPDSPGPLEFFQSYPGGVSEANSAIVDQFRTAMRVGLSRYSFDDLIGPQSRLQAAEQAIMDEMAVVRKKGIEPVSVGISQLMLPPKTSLAVLDRMSTMRNAMADIERNKGDADATAIESKAKADVDKINSFAQQLAAEIRTVSNKNAQNYMEKMNQEPELAIFLIWLDTLETILQRYVTAVLPTSFAPMHLMDLDAPVDAKGIPIPADGNDMPAPRRKAAATQPADVKPQSAAPAPTTTAEVTPEAPERGS